MDEGAVVHIDYDLFNVESGDLIETTREATAKEHDAHEEGKTYSPMVVIVGGGQLIEGFEESLLEAEAGKAVQIDIPAEKAYGERNADLVETLGLDRMMRHVRDPESMTIGSPVEINGRNGVLTYVAAGRARIDFNHPLAGRTLRYDYEIVEVVEGNEAKAAALLESQTGHRDFDVSFDGEDVTVGIPESMMYDSNAAMLKFRLVGSLRDTLGASKVTFQEVHEPRAIDEEE